MRYVNHIIQSAVREGASDIHIEPAERGLKVRFRIDGVLYESMNPPQKMHAAITSRLKIMAQLDIAERRSDPMRDGRARRGRRARPPLISCGLRSVRLCDARRCGGLHH